jgi:hypothetical protein
MTRYSERLFGKATNMARSGDEATRRRFALRRSDGHLSTNSHPRDGRSGQNGRATDGNNPSWPPHEHPVKAHAGAGEGPFDGVFAPLL